MLYQYICKYLAWIGQPGAQSLKYSHCYNTTTTPLNAVLLALAMFVNCSFDVIYQFFLESIPILVFLLLIPYIYSLRFCKYFIETQYK